MTVPIIPGPFSFLATAGQGIEHFGEAVQEHKRFAQEQARKGIEHLENLVAFGIYPKEILTSKEAQHLYSLANIGMAPGSQPIEQPAGARARITSEELARVQPGTPQASAVAQIPTPTQAQATEGKAKADIATSANVEKQAQTAAAAGAPQAKGTLEAAEAQEGLAETALKNEVTEGARKVLGSNPFAAELASEAALGTLQYRIHKLLSDRQYLGVERQIMSDNARLMLAGLAHITTIYHDAKGAHDIQRRNDLINASIDPNDVKAQQDYDTHNPAPTYDQVYNDYVKKNFLMTPEQFAKKLTEGMTGSVREKVTIKGGKGEATPEPAAQAPAVDPAETKINGAIQFVASSRDMASTAMQLAEAWSHGFFSDVELAFIKGQLRQKLTAQQYEEFEERLGAQMLRLPPPKTAEKP